MDLKIGKMLRDNIGYTCEVKTAQETGESGGIRRNYWEIVGEFWGNSGKISEFRGNSREIWGNLGEIGVKFWGNPGRIGELCFPNGETEFTDCTYFPHIREKGGK